MTKRLTKSEIEAVCEALACRLAGPIEDVKHSPEVYASALDKMLERIK